MATGYRPKRNGSMHAAQGVRRVYWGQSYPPLTGADTAEIGAHAWWYYNSPNGTQPVATKPANAFGLYDM